MPIPKLFKSLIDGNMFKNVPNLWPFFIKLNGARKKVVANAHMKWVMVGIFWNLPLILWRYTNVIKDCCIFLQKWHFNFVGDYYVHHLVFSCMRSCRALLGEWVFWHFAMIFALWFGCLECHTGFEIWGRPLNFVGRLCPWFLLHSCIKSLRALLRSECDGATMISAIVMIWLCLECHAGFELCGRPLVLLGDYYTFVAFMHQII